nr:MAG TPA: hypothetical protein [Caudoviricetes sp.]
MSYQSVCSLLSLTKPPSFSQINQKFIHLQIPPGIAL